jgi:hypothetical protein
MATSVSRWATAARARSSHRLAAATGLSMYSAHEDDDTASVDVGR